MAKRYTIAMIECKKHQWVGNGVTCPMCEKPSARKTEGDLDAEEDMARKKRHDELAAERAAGRSESKEQIRQLQEQLQSATLSLDISRKETAHVRELRDGMRAQLEKVRDELKSKMTGSYASAQDRMTAAACNALRMLEAILEGKDE